MLGKTAGGLFWMYRYLERAENTARLIETGQRIALTRSSGKDDEWLSVIQTTVTDQAFLKKYGSVTRDNAVDWMLRDGDNQSSVLSAMKQARDNARLVRTALTFDVWEAVNESWMLLKTALSTKVNERDLPEILALIRQRAALVRGATLGTMLRNDMFDFARLGTFAERADNTCRILDVKYYVLLPRAFSVGSHLDNVQWDTILRALGATGGFRTAFGDDTGPRQIVEFLIYDRRMPRSLRFCCSKLRNNLEYLVRAQPDRQFKSFEMVQKMSDRLAAADTDVVFDQGLHEFLQDFINDLSDLNRQIEIDFRFYE